MSPTDSEGGATARRRLPLLLLVVGIGAATFAPSAPALVDEATAADIEAWAQALVDPERGRTGDRDGIVADWISRLATRPEHPLAEATVRLLSAVRADLDDPTAFREAVLALDPTSGFDAWASAALRRLQGRCRSYLELPDDGGGDLYAETLYAFEVLGPLGPWDHPSAFATDDELWQDPAFSRAHQGLTGPVFWRSFDRPDHASRTFIGEALVEDEGWAYAAARFDVDIGGPAWIEVDSGSAAGTSLSGTSGAVFAYGGSSFRGFDSVTRSEPPPSFALSLNGSSPTVVDRLAAPASAVHREPVVLRTGRNVLVLRFRLASDPGLAIRVLDTTGHPYPGLVGTHEDAPLGAVVDMAPPESLPPDSERTLRALADRGPNSEALLGLLLLLDRRPAEGLHHLSAAVERSDRTGLAALLAGVLDTVDYTPEVWQRGRARELVERVRAVDPDHLPMGIAWAEILAAEDREEEAIALLRRLGDAHPGQARSLLALYGVFTELEMEAEAEAALLSAQERSPRSPLVALRVAAHLRSYGRDREALALEERGRLEAGRTASRLGDLAARHAAVGDIGRALMLWQEALARYPGRNRRLAFARFLAKVGRFDEADAAFATLAREWSRWAAPVLERADLAHLLGDEAAELELLQETLRRRPSHRRVRDRIDELAGREDTEALFARFRLDPAEVRAAYDADAWDDSVVKVLDLAVVKVFEDGALDVLTQEVLHLRDLEATQREGEQALPGEVLRVATVKADGTVYEPVKVARTYVMPNVEPGDFLEMTTREGAPPPGDGVVRPGRWFFQSVSEPYVISRYVISVPKVVPLRLAMGNFDGVHETWDEGRHVVHLFEVRDAPRVLAERGAPPAHWFLPWVELGMDDDEPSIVARLQDELARRVVVTPEIRAAAAEVVDGVEGEEARARALYEFVSEHLDARYGSLWTATRSLLAREGNPAILYAALLEAAGIERELVWSRGVPPGAELDPDPPFLDEARFRPPQALLLVRVHPEDGEAAWCDPRSRTMPYGELFGNAPGARSLSVTTGEGLSLPDPGLAGLPGQSLELGCRIEPDGNATIEGKLSMLGGIGFVSKEQLEEVPEPFFKRIVEGNMARFVSGVDVEDYSIEGLDDVRARVAFALAGKAPLFLDTSGPRLTRPLPIEALQLSANVASEGERKLPYMSSGVGVNLSRVTLELADGLELVDPPRDLEVSFGGWDYRFSMRRADERTWTLERELRVMPFSIDAADYAEFAGMCARIDDAERVQLQFERVSG